jgi:hypothetical protein
MAVSGEAYSEIAGSLARFRRSDRREQAAGRRFRRAA